MMAIFAGSTPKFLLKIKNESGTQLDPSDITGGPGTVAEVKIFIYNAISGALIGKWYLRTLPDQSGGWSQLSTKLVAEGDCRVLLVLTSAQTLAAEGNSNIIQADTHINDTDVPGGIRIEKAKVKFAEVLPVKS